MRPGCESLGEGIEKQNRDGQRRELQRKGIQLPCGDEENRNGGNREDPCKGNGKRAGGQRTLFRARIFFVVAKIGDAVDGHGGGARRNHGDDNPENLPKGRPAVQCGARRQQRARQREGQRKHGVLELDHFQDGADAAGHRSLRPRFLPRNAARPAMHFFLRQAGLRQNAANKLRHQIVDRFWLIVKRGIDRHDHRSGLLCAQHVFQMDAIERRVAHAKINLRPSLSITSAERPSEIVADAVGNRGERAHGAGNHNHGVDVVAARSDGCANIFVGKCFDFSGSAADDARREASLGRRK